MAISLNAPEVLRHVIGVPAKVALQLSLRDLKDLEQASTSAAIYCNLKGNFILKTSEMSSVRRQLCKVTLVGISWTLSCQLGQLRSKRPSQSERASTYLVAGTRLWKPIASRRN